MSQAATVYAEKTAAGAWRVAGSRVSLDSVVQLYWAGLSPEAIAEEFPSLSVEHVYGAIAFYLHHRQEIDAYLKEQNAAWQGLQSTSQSQHGPLLDRLRQSRKQAS